MAQHFNQELKGKTPETHRVLLKNFEGIADILFQQSRKEFSWNPPSDPRLLLNHYLDILWAVHVSKFNELCQSLIEAANRNEFIVYGLIGRSIIEHAATMRYFLKERISKSVDKAAKQGEVTIDDIEVIISELDRFLRGGRFDWEAFLTGKFDELLARGKKGLLPTQVNVIKCIEKWAKSSPKVSILYDLFCDLVHPNIGSTLLIMRKHANDLGFGGHGGEPVGYDIFIRTLAGLVAAFKEILEHLNTLLLLQFQDVR